MATFDPNDPKYISCCCGAHVTKVARVLVTCVLVSTLLYILFAPSIPMAIGISIEILGTISVFKEIRIGIIAYIILGILLSGIDLIRTLNELEDGPIRKIRYAGAYGTEQMINIVVTLAIIIPYTVGVWNLAQFIKDRDRSQQLPVQYEAKERNLLRKEQSMQVSE